MAAIEFNCESCKKSLSVKAEYAGMQYECPHCGFQNTVPTASQDEKCSDCGKKLNIWSRNPLTGTCEDCAKKRMQTRQTDRCTDCGKLIKGFDRFPDTNLCTDCYLKREKALQKPECQECGKNLTLFTRIVGTNYCFDCTDKLRNSGRLPKCSNCGVPLNIGNVEPGTAYCSQCLNNDPSLLDKTAIQQNSRETVFAPAGVLQDDPFSLGTTGDGSSYSAQPSTMDIGDEGKGEKKTKARYKILFGLLWVIGGFIATSATEGEYLFWGAILFGFIDMLVGLFQGLAEGF